MLKNEGCTHRCSYVHVSKVEEYIAGYLLVSWWLKFYRIQAKVEIVGFMFCIPGLREWSIGPRMKIAVAAGVVACYQNAM